MPNGELNTDSLHLNKKQLTPQKFNIAPEKGWFENYFSFGTVYFPGRTVKLQVGNHNVSITWKFRQPREDPLEACCCNPRVYLTKREVRNIIDSKVPDG